MFIMNKLTKAPTAYEHLGFSEPELGDRLSLLRQQLKIKEDFGKFSIGHSPLVIVGDFSPQTVSGDHLIITPKGSKPGYSMEYVLHLDVEKPKIVLRDLQKSSGFSRETLLDSLDGVNPGELLIQNFIKRAKPILEAMPDTEIVLVGESFRMDPDKTRRVYKPLRDRFFKRNWHLSTDKKRVQEILGEELCKRMKSSRHSK